MPFEVMNQRGVSTLSHFYDDISFPPEKNPGLRKQKSIHERYPQGKSEITASPGSILNASSPRGMNAKTGLPMSQTGLSSEGTGSTRFGGKEGIADVLKDSKELLNYHPRSWTDVRMQPASSSYGFIGNKIVANAASRESSLFSSSLSDMFTQKLRLMGNDVFRDQSVSVGSLPEEEPYKSLQEIEADTIGNLLPDEDDLFSGVADELGSNVHAKANDDFEDFDLFSSGGGMELEGDEHLVSGKRASGLEGDLGYFGGSKGKIPLGDQSSRTLFVRNINSNVDDSELKTLFEQYGDIRTMYTACKPRGFVMISYYDIRAAQNAMKALQHKSLRSRKLDIHYSIPKGNAPEKDIGHGGVMISGLDSSVSNDELKHIFGSYGEIKEVMDLDRRVRRGRERLAQEVEPAPAPPLTTEKSEQLSVLEEKIKNLLEQVESLGEAGKVDEAEALMRKVDALNVEKTALTQPQNDKVLMLGQEKKMALCEICGSFLVANDAAERTQSHITGKQHVGYGMVRDFISEYKAAKEKAVEEERLAREKEAEERRKQREKDHERRRRSDSSDRDRHRDKDRDRDRDRYRDRDLDRERSRELDGRGNRDGGRGMDSRLRNGRNGGRDRYRNKSRSRSPVRHNYRRHS